MNKPLQSVVVVEIYRNGGSYHAVLVGANSRIFPQESANSEAQALRDLANLLEAMGEFRHAST